MFTSGICTRAAIAGAIAVFATACLDSQWQACPAPLTHFCPAGLACTESGCVPDSCGDGIALQPEDCDGDDLGLATDCRGLGYYTAGNLACRSDCGYDLATCESAGYCGDAIINGTELCDGEPDPNALSCVEYGFDRGRLGCIAGACLPDVSACRSFGWGRAAGPYPHRLHAIWGSGLSDLHVVGESGTWIHFDGTEWFQQYLPGGSELNLGGIWGSSPTDVWAVGTSGAIFHYDGTDWVRWNDSGTTADLHTVWGRSASDVYAAGAAGTIVHFDGTTWSQHSAPDIDDDILAIHGGDTVIGVATHSGVWVDDGGWTKGEWTLSLDSTADQRIFHDIEFIDDDNAVAVGRSQFPRGQIAVYSQASGWRPAGDMETDLLRGYGRSLWLVDGAESTPGGIFAIIGEENGIIEEWAQSFASDNLTDTNYDGGSVRDIWVDGFVQLAVTENEIFQSVGDSAVLTQVDDPLMADPRAFEDIWADDGTTDDGTTVVVGAGGAAYSYSKDELPWNPISSPAKWLFEVWGRNGDDVWAVGADGQIVHFNGSGWSDLADFSIADEIPLFNLWGTPEPNGDVYIVGAQGALLRLSGDPSMPASVTTEAIDSGTTTVLRAVFGLSADEIYVGGGNGLLLRCRPITGGSAPCTAIDGLPNDTSVLAIWGASADELYVGTGSKGIHRCDFDGCMEIPASPIQANDITAGGPGELWIAGGQHGLFRLDLATGEFERINTSTQSSITGVAVRDGGTTIQASTSQGEVARIHRPFPW